MSNVVLTIELNQAQQALREANEGKPRNLTESELMVIQEGRQLILNQFTQTWPVKTGLSKAGWRVKIRTRGALGYLVFNDVDYSSYVFRAGEGPDPLWPKLLNQVENEIIPYISDQLIQMAELDIERKRAEKRRDQALNAVTEEFEREGRAIMMQAMTKRPLIKAVRRLRRAFG